ncbi:cation-translocating P-type ATPase [Gordonia sp. NPDC003424]
MSEPFLRSAVDVAADADVDPNVGLASVDAAVRLKTYGPNELTSEPPPSIWAVSRGQLANPMNIMLLIVAVAALAIGQIATGIVVGVLVMFNVVMGTRQEMKAQASVDALSSLQVPHARVRRGGQVAEVPAADLVPGDIVLVEAGDLVPADGRLITSATLEVQEAALTGESAPVAKDPGVIAGDADVALGDRTNMVFQNTQVTRGSAIFVVTSTGAATQMGRIADMVTATKRTKSPLQIELDGLTKVFGFLAWGAVVIIGVVGFIRGQNGETLALLCISTAIASIPTGLPTFVQTMLSSGAQHLAEQKAVVKSLADVETLGGTTVINSDKTGTLTMNAMTVVSLYVGDQWYRVDGSGYSKTGAILGAAGPLPDFTPLALGLSLCSDATVGDDGSVIGDPTEAALVVLAAKMGVDAETTRSTIPRVTEVPFDSDYKFMATFHDRPPTLAGPVIDQPHLAVVKGGPDVVLDRCGSALRHGAVVPVDEMRRQILDANRKLSEKGLRVLAFAAKSLDDNAMSAAVADPMAAVRDLVFVGLVGIIDPLRTEATDAVHTALGAGIDVRMITGDHTITARAIADQLGLGPGVITGTELQRLSDDEVKGQLPQLHVFGRVAPEDKLRLARLMQEEGDVVAMTGDAVNDAAALKQADVGVAMGSGSEVSKQAAKMILTDDNFATLVRAVELGRDIYRRISTYIRLQLTVLSSVLQLMVFATIFNINGGVAMLPMQLLFCKLFVIVTVVVGLIVDVPDPGVMQMPPRKPGTRIVAGPQVVRWVISGFLVAVSALSLLEWGPDEPSSSGGSVSMTMAFAVVALTGVNLGVVMRRERQVPWSQPMFPYFGWLIAGWALTWAAVELGMLQRLLDTVSLTGAQWLVVLGLSLITPAFVGIDKAIQLRRQRDQASRRFVTTIPATNTATAMTRK